MSQLGVKEDSQHKEAAVLLIRGVVFILRSPYAESLRQR